MAHDIPVLHSRGVKKTRKKLQYYCWPRVCRNVYRAYCEVCQKSDRSRASEKSKLVAMLIVGMPFRRVAINMVGLPEQRKRTSMC